MAFDKTKCFCQGQCRADAAIQLSNQGETEKAFAAARKAVLDAPRCPFGHGLLGTLMTNNGRAPYAERHINIAKVLGDAPARSEVHLGYCYVQQGKLPEAEKAFRTAMRINPKLAGGKMGLAKVHELNGRFDEALELVDDVAATDLTLHGLGVLRAKILCHFGRDAEALTVLPVNEPLALFERGRIKENLGDYAGAWQDYQSANRQTKKVYDDAEVARRFANHKTFATKGQLGRLPNIRLPLGANLTPIFITGFPRSGTTLAETLLSNHSKIGAGDELKHIHDIAGFSQQWLDSSDPYPFALGELALGDKTAILRAFRAYYVAKAMQVATAGKPFLTDKMPLNEMHLPLISMIFGEAPIFYVRRHPLDIIVSNFSTYLTHGFNQSFDLVTCATHYSRVDDLLLHYKHKVEMNFREIRYETLVEDTRGEIAGALDYIGLPFEDACTAPQDNPNHPRTPSYEAVKQPVNDRAIGRWKNFEPYLGEALRIVEPIISREGY